MKNYTGNWLQQVEVTQTKMKGVMEPNGVFADLWRTRHMRSKFKEAPLPFQRKKSALLIKYNIRKEKKNQKVFLKIKKSRENSLK